MGVREDPALKIGRRRDSGACQRSLLGAAVVEVDMRCIKGDKKMKSPIWDASRGRGSIKRARYSDADLARLSTSLHLYKLALFWGRMHRVVVGAATDSHQERGDLGQGPALQGHGDCVSGFGASVSALKVWHACLCPERRHVRLSSGRMT